MHPTYWKEITTIIHETDEKKALKARVAAGLLSRLKAAGAAKPNHQDGFRAAKRRKRELPENLQLIQRWQEVLTA